jgi:hypothetical protein
MEGELHALLEAVRLASIDSDARTYCEVYTDAKPLKSKLTEADELSGKWADYRDSAHWLLNKFDDWEIVWCPRQSNEKAHKLAREALAEGRNVDQNY